MPYIENKVNPDVEEILKNIQNVPSKSPEGRGEIDPINKAEYDPRKRYSWEPGSNFLLSGEEFGVILNSLRAILNTPESQRILLANKANEAIENSLAKAVRIGVAKADEGLPQNK